MKNNGILLIKAVAIIGVVFQHLHNRRFEPEALQWTDAVSQFFCWCVLAFLAASGWLHALVEQKKARSFLDFFQSRVRRLLVPFVILVVVYAAGFEIVQRTGAMSMRGTLPESFIGKVMASLWPVDQQRTVAEQLYFLPLLFLISLPVHALAHWGKARAVLFLGLASYVAALFFYPQSPNTGFSLGVFMWGLFSYCIGYWMHGAPSTSRNLILSVLGAACLFVVAGPVGLYKMVPIAFLAVLPWIEKTRESWLSHVGEASGTIYIYHTPFLIQPLLIIAATRIHSWPGQVAAALGLSFLVIAFCTALHLGLRQTRLRGLLM